MSNAYERLLAAARSLAGTDLLGADDEISDAAAAAYLAANRPAMNAAREALQNRCAVTLERTFAFFERYSPACCDLLKLGQSFCLAARHAERRDDIALAVCEGVAALDLANSLRRGGIMIGMLVANIVEGLAIERLRRIHRRLTADRARDLARELLRIDAEREPFDDIVARDEQWEQSVVAQQETADFTNVEWPEDVDEGDARFLNEAMQRIADMPRFERRELERRLDDRELTRLRLLAIESALTAHFRDHGSHAAVLPHLVPGQLPTLPLDPFTGEPLRYVASAEECLVYSPGPTGVDHGGKFGCWLDVEAGSADLCLAMSDFSCGAGP